MTISFDLTADQRQIAGSVGRVLRDRWPVFRFRNGSRAKSSGAEFADAVELGCLGLSVPENDGGAGFTVVEDVLAFRELGRHLITQNVLASVVAIKIALGAGNKILARQFLEGDVIACLANPVKDSPANYFLYDSEGAKYALVLHGTDIALLPIDLFQFGNTADCLDKTVTLRPAQGPDLTHHLAIRGSADVRLFAELLLSSELLGVGESAMELAVAYAKTRHQFGQPIGAFQAVKHSCADMKIRVAVLQAQVLLAALSLRERRADAELQITAAGLLAVRYALRNAAAGIQIHGAMGFTAECDAHLYLLRAHLLENIGNTQGRREQLMLTLPPTAV